MAETIKGSQIIEDDHLNNPIKSAEALKKAYLDLDKAVIKLNKSVGSLTKGKQGQTAKDIQIINTALKESTNIRNESISVDKQKLQLDKQLKAATDENVKGALRMSQAKKEQKILLEAEIAQKNKLAGTEEKILAQNKKLRLERKKLNTGTKQGSTRLKEINAQLDRNNAILEKNSDKLKKQRLGIGKYSKAVNGLRGGLAKLGLAVGVFTVLKDAFNVTKDFDQAQADLSSVLAVTREEMASLTDQAKELGATTKFTASQVSELQLEYAKLGFTQSEIDNVTASTLELASAAGTDLANAATITGSTLRGFGLDSTETQRVVDVMAKSFSSSSLDITKFASAMSAVAPVASGAGVSLEKTTALLGTLTDRGIDASSAGTGLRNMFLSATAAGITFDEALDQVRNSQDKTAKSLQLFGKKGATLGVILAENGESVDSLTGKLEASGGAAKEMADKQLDTLQGSLDLLRSAWEGYILGADGASGASDKLKGIVKFLADNLNTILNTIGAIATAFGVYKTATLALSVVQKSMAFITQAWVAAQWLLNAAMAANPIGLIVIAVAALIAGVTALIALINGWGTATKKLTDIQKKNNLINEQALKIGKEILSQNKEEISDVSVLIDALIDENTTREEKNEIIAKLNEDYPELIGNIDLETASTATLINLKKQLITQILNEGIARVKAEKLSLITAQIIDKELKKIGAGETGINQLQKEIDELTASIPLIEEIAEKVKSNLSSTVEGIDFSSAFRDENDKITALQFELSELRTRLSNAQTEEEKTAIQKRINTVQDELNREQGIRTQMLDDALDKEKDINSESEKDFVKKEKSKTKKLKTELEIRQQLFADIQAQDDENLKIIENNAIKEGKSREEIDKILAKKRIEILKKQNDDTLRIFGVGSEQYLDANLALNRALLLQDEEGNTDRADSNQQRFDDIVAQNVENLKILESELLSQGKSRKEIDEILKEERLNQLEQEMNEALRIFGEGSAEFLDAKLAFQNAEQKLEDDANKKRLDDLKNLRDESVKIFKDIADSRIAELDRQIEANQNEIDASQEEVSRLQGIGTAAAAEAIKAEKIGQAKEKLAIEKLEKKKKDLLFTVAGLERVSQLIGSGDQNPFKTTEGEMKGFVESLKGFKDGTPTTIADAMGKPHLNTKSDGYIARLDGPEMVMSTKKSLALQKAGIGTTDDLFSNAMKWQNRGMMNNAMNVTVKKENDSDRLVEKLSARFEKAIDNIEIPQTEFDMEKLIKTVKGKNTVKRTHYDKPDLNL